jgi:hypothetical protein
MNLKLDELRKRLLEPVATPATSPTSIYRRSSHELRADQSRSATAGPELITDAPIAPVKTNTVDAEPAIDDDAGNSVSSAVLQYVQRTTAASIEGESMDQQNSQYQLAQAVAKVFEQTKTFQEKFAELTRMFEPIEQLGEAAARSFEPLRTFEGQLVQLAHSFEPMRAFQLQLAELAQTFEPMKGLQQQLAQLSEAFQLHLNRLAGSLEPAKEFQLELLKLARAFDPVADLQAQFSRLVDTFKGAPATGVENGNGNGVAQANGSIQH